MAIRQVLFICAYFNCFALFAQTADTIDNDNKLAFSISPGISFQTFMFERWLAPKQGAVLNSILSAYGNAEGFGVTLPISIYLKNFSTGLTFNPILRYEPIYRSPFRPVIHEDIWAFFADYHFSIYRNIYLKKSFLKNYLGISLCMLELGLV